MVKQKPIPVRIEKPFITIDFETANSNLSSICSIGVAFSDGRDVVKSKHYYVKPIPFKVKNTHINNISEDDVINAPSFAEVWSELFPEIKGEILYTYNAKFDANCLREAVRANGMNSDSYEFNFGCIFELIKSVRYKRELGLDDSVSLVNTCASLGIEIDNAHNAECDAVAAAKILMECEARINTKGINDHHEFIYEYSSMPITNIRHIPERRDFGKPTIPKDRTITDKALLSKNLDDVINRTVFFDKRVVVTGELRNYTRDSIAKTLYDLGVDVNTSISKKTDYVIIGDKPGPSKLKKIKELIESGCELKVISEDEFISLVNQ